jgi:hypothetical protein
MIAIGAMLSGRGFILVRAVAFGRAAGMLGTVERLVRDGDAADAEHACDEEEGEQDECHCPGESAGRVHED